MNQKILIVFILFLLIIILLLLLISSGKAKSEKIQVLAYLPAPESELSETIKSFLEKLAYEGNFVFTIAGESDEWTTPPQDSYSVVIRFLPFGYGEEENWINPAGRGLLDIHIGRDASYYNDPDFLIRVRQAILQAAFSVH